MSRRRRRGSDGARNFACDQPRPGGRAPRRGWRLSTMKPARKAVSGAAGHLPPEPLAAAKGRATGSTAHKMAKPTRLAPTNAFFREKARLYREFRAEAEAWAAGAASGTASIIEAADKAARANDAEALSQAVGLLARGSGAALSWLRRALAEGDELSALAATIGPGFVKAKAREAVLSANGRVGSVIGVAARQEKARGKTEQILAEWERLSKGGESRAAAAIVARICEVPPHYVRRIVRKSKRKA